MTAQASDLLQWDGESYRIRGFVSLPAAVALPPKEAHVHSTAYWRGYTCQWEVKNTETGPKLFLVGFDCDDYFPLAQPVINPITDNLRVVRVGAKCLHYEHMGFGSKFEGEMELCFNEGTLVGVRAIPDDTPNQDGLLDMALLFPEGKEVGDEMIRAFLEDRAKEDDDKAKFENSCYACRRSFLWSRSIPRRHALCHQCWQSLHGIARHMHHWHTGAEYDGTAPYLSDRAGGSDSPQVSPAWHEKSGLSGFASFEFSSDRNQVIIEFSGHEMFKAQAPLECAFDAEDPDWWQEDSRSKAEDHIFESLTNFLKRYDGLNIDRDDVRVLSDEGHAMIDVFLRRKFIVQTASPRTDSTAEHAWAARDLEKKMDASGHVWVAELILIAGPLRRRIRDTVSEMTEGTGIFPYDPSDLTPADARILWQICDRASKRANTRWAIPPQHASTGWIPGETIRERYMRSLND